MPLPVVQIPFVHPSTMIVSGPTGCGKTQFVMKLLENNMFVEPETGLVPDRIIWMYGAEQEELFRQLAAMRVELFSGFNREILDSLDSNERNLIVLDDLMTEMKNSDDLEKLFTKGSHHKNLTVIYLVQNLFEKGKATVSVSRNAHYIVLFKNPRNQVEVNTLASQMAVGSRRKSLLAAFQYATKKNFRYLVFDNRPETDPGLRFRTKIFPGETTKILALEGDDSFSEVYKREKYEPPSGGESDDG